jgi:hypothetical protein
MVTGPQRAACAKRAPEFEREIPRLGSTRPSSAKIGRRASSRDG